MVCWYALVHKFGNILIHFFSILPVQVELLGGRDPAFLLLFFVIWHPKSYFGFGYPKDFGSYKSWILQWRDKYGAKESWGSNR